MRRRGRRRAPAAPGTVTNVTSAAAIRAGSRTRSTQPVAIALHGIEPCSAVAGSWAITRPPRALIVCTPAVPSCSRPDSTTASARGPNAPPPRRRAVRELRAGMPGRQLQPALAVTRRGRPRAGR